MEYFAIEIAFCLPKSQQSVLTHTKIICQIYDSYAMRNH